MQRHRLLLLSPLVPLGIFVSRYLRALAPKPPQPVTYQHKLSRPVEAGRTPSERALGDARDGHHRWLGEQQNTDG